MQTIVIDLHKMGLAPYPAGVFLSRRNLMKITIKNVDYMGQKDWTVTCSRPGVSAACWAVIKAMGKTKYSRIVWKGICLKNWFYITAAREIPRNEEL